MRLKPNQIPPCPDCGKYCARPNPSCYNRFHLEAMVRRINKLKKSIEQRKALRKAAKNWKAYIPPE